MYKPGLCSNNKFSTTSIVFLSGILVNKLKKPQENTNLLAALIVFISLQNVNESFVQ